MPVRSGLLDANTSVSLLVDARQQWRITSPYYFDFGVRSEIKHRLTRRHLAQRTGLLA